MSIPFPISNNEFNTIITNCSDDECKTYAAAGREPLCAIDKDASYTGNKEDYNNLLNKIINHFNYTIALNNETKTTLGKKINENNLEKRYTYYDSLDIDYQNTWIKKLTFWMYFLSITIYILVFIINKSYKKKIEFLYLLLIIALPFFSNKILHIINYFYKFNVLFTKN